MHEEHTSPLRITLVELREVFAIVMEHLAETRGDEIVIEHDYFWSIPHELRYDTFNPPEPAELTLGQVSFCIEDLRRLLREPDSVIRWDMVWLAQVLEAVGSSPRSRPGAWCNSFAFSSALLLTMPS